MLGRTNTGGGNSIHLNIRNYAVLPATGRRNDIALINNNPINHVYVQSGTPSSPEEGDVFFRVGRGGNVYFWFKPVAVGISTCQQYLRTGGTDEEPEYTWTVIPEWYMYMADGWKRGRLYLILDGEMTNAQTFTARKWKQTSGATTPPGTTAFSQESGYVRIYHKNDSTTAGEYGAAGITTPNFGAGQFSKVFIEMASSSSYADCERYIAIADYNDSYIKLNPYAYKDITTATSETRTQTTVDITYTDNPCCVYVGMNVRNNGNISTIKIYTLYLE